MPNAVILFYSHRWKRPNWSEALGKELPWSSEERQAAMLAHRDAMAANGQRGRGVQGAEYAMACNSSNSRFWYTHVLCSKLLEP